MEEYRIPVQWQMEGEIVVREKNLKSAIEYVFSEDTPLPKECDYVQGSLSLYMAKLYAEARAHFPDSDREYFEELLSSMNKK